MRVDPRPKGPYRSKKKKTSKFEVDGKHLIGFNE